MINNIYNNFGSYLGFGISAITLFTAQSCEFDEVQWRKNKPNVILIMADDMGLGDLSFINPSLSRTTPNLDKLVEEGVWLSQAYAASTVCAPSRAALLTGLYPHQTGCVTLNMASFPELTRVDESLSMIADAFSDNGYVTGLIGKWHCGEGEGYHPMDRGYKVFEGFLGYMVNSYFTYELDINRTYKKFDNRYLTYELSDRAIEFVRRHKDVPFYLELAHYAPHRPIGAPEEFIVHYLEKGYDENTATIYAMIEIMDKGIGQLVAELDHLGIRDNTLIIFTSDNGPDPLTGERFNLGLRGAKYDIYEGGIHVPLILNWQNKMEPAHIKELIHHTDIFPTLVDICKLELSDDIPFVGGSIAGLLMGEPEYNLPEDRYWQWNRGVPRYSHNAAMRRGNWKLVRPFVTRGIPEGASDRRPELYDLENDPFEENDVSKQNQQVYATMNVYLEQWTREMEFRRLRNTDK